MEKDRTKRMLHAWWIIPAGIVAYYILMGLLTEGAELADLKICQGSVNFICQNIVEFLSNSGMTAAFLALLAAHIVTTIVYLRYMDRKKDFFIMTGINVTGILFYTLTLKMTFQNPSLYLACIMTAAQITLTTLMVLKRYQKRYLIPLAALILITILFISIPSEDCYSISKKGVMQDCDCLGFQRYHDAITGYRTDCIGIRTACYKPKDGQMVKVECG